MASSSSVKFSLECEIPENLALFILSQDNLDSDDGTFNRSQSRIVCPLHSNGVSNRSTVPVSIPAPVPAPVQTTTSTSNPLSSIWQTISPYCEVLGKMAFDASRSYIQNKMLEALQQSLSTPQGASTQQSTTTSQLQSQSRESTTIPSTQQSTEIPSTEQPVQENYHESESSCPMEFASNTQEASTTTTPWITSSSTTTTAASQSEIDSEITTAFSDMLKKFLSKEYMVDRRLDKQGNVLLWSDELSPEEIEILSKAPHTVTVILFLTGDRPAYRISKENAKKILGDACKDSFEETDDDTRELMSSIGKIVKKALFRDNSSDRRFSMIGDIYIWDDEVSLEELYILKCCPVIKRHSSLSGELYSKVPRSTWFFIEENIMKDSEKITLPPPRYLDVTDSLRKQREASESSTNQVSPLSSQINSLLTSFFPESKETLSPLLNLVAEAFTSSSIASSSAPPSSTSTTTSSSAPSSSTSTTSTTSTTSSSDAPPSSTSISTTSTTSSAPPSSTTSSSSSSEPSTFGGLKSLINTFKKSYFNDPENIIENDCREYVNEFNMRPRNVNDGNFIPIMYEQVTIFYTAIMTWETFFRSSEIDEDSETYAKKIALIHKILAKMEVQEITTNQFLSLLGINGTLNMMESIGSLFCQFFKDLESGISRPSINCVRDLIKKTPISSFENRTL